MTYEELREYAITCGNFHPDCAEPLGDIIRAIATGVSHVPFPLAEAMARYIDEQRAIPTAGEPPAAPDR